MRANIELSTRHFAPPSLVIARFEFWQADRTLISDMELQINHWRQPSMVRTTWDVDTLVQQAIDRLRREDDLLQQRR